MKRKGFTLIELLAAIVILAVIALITTTVIIKVVENSRKNAAKNSALNYLDAVEKYVMYHEVNDTKYPEEIKPNSLYQISNKEYTVPEGKTAVENKNLNDILGNTIKGEKPDTGIVEFDEKRKVVSASMVINNYNVTCTSSTSCTVEGKNTDPIPVLTINEDNIKVTETKITIPYTVEIEKGSASVECVYGTDENYGQTGTINEENNTCILSNLTKNTTYYYKLTPKSDKNKQGEKKTGNKTTTNNVHTTEFKLGDYVYMIPSYEGSYTPTTDSSSQYYTGTNTPGSVTPSELRRWIIIKTDETNIEMVSESVSSTDITFSGQVGYNNYVGALNKIAEQYENSTFTIGSRIFGYYSQDLQCSKYNDFSCVDSDGAAGDTGFTGTGHPNSYGTSSGCVYDAMSVARGTSIKPLLAYKVNTSTYKTSSTAGYYWVASRGHWYDPDNGSSRVGMYKVTDAGLLVRNAFCIESGCGNETRGIRPILKLKSDVVADPSGDGSSEKPWVLIEQ